MGTGAMMRMGMLQRRARMEVRRGAKMVNRRPRHCIVRMCSAKGRGDGGAAGAAADDDDDDDNEVHEGLKKKMGDHDGESNTIDLQDRGKSAVGMESLRKPLLILTGSQFLNNLGFGSVIPVLPIFATELGLGASGVGMILSTSAAARLMMNIPAGRLSDTFGRIPLMVSGQLITSLASIGTGLSASLPQLLFARLLLGAGGSLSMAGSGAYLADVTSSAPHLRGKVIGFQSTVISMAYAVGPALGGYLCDLYGARTMFFLLGGAAAVASAGFYGLPESHPSSSDTAPKKFPKHLLREPNQQGLVAMNFAVFGSYSCLMAVFPLHAASILGDSGSATTIGALFATSAIVGFVGAPLGGFLCDKIGRKRTVVPAGVLIVLGTVSTGMATGGDALLCSILLWGLGNSLLNPGLSAFAADVAEDKSTRSQALSLSRMAGDAAFLVCPISLGSLAHLTDCFTALCASAAGTLGATMFFAARTTELYKRVHSR